MTIPLKLSASQVGTWQACPTKYWNQYGVGRVSALPSAALSFGKVWHELMEYYWRDGASIGDLAAAALDYEEDLGIENACRMAALLECYSPPRSDFEVESVEQDIEIPIVNPDTGRPMHHASLLVRVDGILVEKLTGLRFILEHKTTSQKIFGYSQWWQAKSLDRQLGFYYLAVPDCDGIIYDVVRKPGQYLSGKDGHPTEPIEVTAPRYLARLQSLVEASPDEFYQWRGLYRTEQDLAKVQRDLYAVAQQIRASVRGGWFPRNSDACRNPYTCDYIDVCSGAASLDDDALFTDRAPAPWAERWAV